MPSAPHKFASLELPPPGARDAGREGALRDFERAVVEHGPMLHKRASRLTRDAADASDLVQDTLERALRRPQGFRSGSNLRAWLLTIMTHLFIDRCRRGQRENQLAAVEPDGLAAPAIDEVPRWAELTQAEVRCALAQLDPTFREPYELHAIERLSYQAVALRLSIPVATVGTRLIRARQRLRVLLEQGMGKGEP